MLSPSGLLLASGCVGDGGTELSVCPSIHPSGRKAAQCPAVLPACIPMLEQAAPLCQSPQGTGAENLFQKSSTTGRITV